MTPQEYDREFLRLEDQWPNAYKGERKKALWPIFRGFSAVAFSDGVTDCLLNCRQSPLLKELEAAVADADKREREARYQNRNASALSVLQDAAKKTSANPDLVKACIDAVKWKIEKRPSKEEWESVMKYIDTLAQSTKSEQRCKSCNNSGVVFRPFQRHGQTYEAVYQCFCPEGGRQTSLRPAPSIQPPRQERERVSDF